MSEETRVILPHLPKFSGASSGNEAGGGETMAPVGRVRNVNHANANKRVMTGLTSGPHHIRKSGREPMAPCDSHSRPTLNVAADFRQSTGLTLTGIHQDKSTCLPAIEISEEHRQPKVTAEVPLVFTTPNTHAGRSTTPSPLQTTLQTNKQTTTPPPLGSSLESKPQQWVTMAPPLPLASDAAYIRSRSVTPSLLGAPRDLLSRSKKTSRFAGYLPNLPQTEDECSIDGSLALKVEGHHDLKLPPRRTPTESRRVEKSRHNLSTLTSISHILNVAGADDVTSWEENLKTLLLCQSMGVRLEVANADGHDTQRSARPVFHCPRCYKHWTEIGTTPPNCDEPELPTFGPTFEISTRSHEIIREFASLSLGDKRQVVDVIMNRESAAIGFDGRDEFYSRDSMLDVSLTGRRAMKVGESVTKVKMSADIQVHTETYPPSIQPPVNDVDQRYTAQASDKIIVPRKDTTNYGVVMHTMWTDPQTQAEDRKSVGTKDIDPTEEPESNEDHNDEPISRDDVDPTGESTPHKDQRPRYQIESSIGSETITADPGIHHTSDTDRYSKPPADCIPETRHVPSPLNGKHDQSEEQNQSEVTGQYGPDGAYYPGHYGPDGRFLATCRIARDGQRHNVVMGPDGHFYSNAHYGPDGRFHLGEEVGDKRGVLFLNAPEMAALRANQTPVKQGVVGPDGLFYPHGLYQSNGVFIPGGPPHAGHPVVWGPTLGSHDTGYPFPPTEFGPAWPPGTPAPYTHDQPLTVEIGDEDQTRRSSDGGMVASSPAPTYTNRVDHTSLSVETSPHHEHLTAEEAFRMSRLGSESSSIGLGEPSQPRDLFSPWGKDDELQVVPSFHQTEKCTRVDDGKEDIDVTDLGQMERDSCDDLNQDVPLSNLDSRIVVGSEDEFVVQDGFDRKMSQSVGDKNDTDAVLEEPTTSAKQDNVEKSVLEDHDQTAVQEKASTDVIDQKKHRDSTATYMGVMVRTDSSYSSRRDSSHSHIAKARRGSVVTDTRTGSGRRGSKALATTGSKPGKNLAVKNVTGKPETRPGMLQKHMFATPSETLAQTTLGINNSRRGSRAGAQESSVQSVGNASVASKDDILATIPKLPSIGGGEAVQDEITHRTPSPIKQVQQSISRIGSGEKRPKSSADNVLIPPDNSVKPRVSGKRGSKVKKKARKQVRKTVGKRQDIETDNAEMKAIDKKGSGSNATVRLKASGSKEIEKLRASSSKEIEMLETSVSAEAIKDAEATRSRSAVTSPSKKSVDDIVSTYHDIAKYADTTISRANCEEKQSIAKLTDSSSILAKFSEFRVSVPASPSPLPTEHAPSFRMTYSTLPNFATNEPQCTAPKSDEDIWRKTEKKPSKSKSIPFDFERVEKGYDTRARTSSTRSLLNRKSNTKTGHRSKRNRQRSGSVYSDTSSRASSAESAVWESISDIWKRHKDEIANMKKCVADSYLPLTNAYTFSMFPLAPGYADRNRLIWERASAIKQLRKPIKFNKPRRAAKPAKKRSAATAYSLPVKAVSSTAKTVAPVK